MGAENEYTYDDWAELLAGFFFSEEQRGSEVLFAVDDVSLAEIAGLAPDEACQSLATAVRHVIGDRWNVSAVKQRVARWRRSGADLFHPALPFLALTVLAAYRMGSYEGIPPHNFYVPLRRTLAAGEGEQGAPGSYLTHIRGLWEDLTKWVNDDRAGSYGRLTIREPGHQWGRGLATQHALVKTYDLQQLDAYFRVIGLKPGDEPTGAELRRGLAVWTRGRHQPWAKRLCDMAMNEELIEHAEALLARQAAGWDGRPRDPRTGRPIGHLRLAIRSVRKPDLELHIQWDDRLPDRVTLQVPNTEETTFRRDGDDSWFAPDLTGEADPATVLSGGWELQGDVRFSLLGREVYAFTFDDDLGRWVSADALGYGDPFHLVVHRAVLTEVEAFVRDVSALDVRVDERASARLPNGWAFIANLRIDARPTQVLPEPLAGLLPTGRGPQLGLLGGLPVPLRRGVYLQGGAPTVALSTLSDSTRLTIEERSTGCTQSFSLPRGQNEAFPLWHLSLPPDTYELRHDESRATIEIVDGIKERIGPGAGTVSQAGRGTEVVGTSLTDPSSAAWPITVQAPQPGECSILIGPAAEDYYLIRCPDWLVGIAGELSWRTIDAWPRFEPVWHIRRREDSGRYEASLLNAIAPMSNQRTAGSQWARLIALTSLEASSDAVTLWTRYKEAAGASDDG